MSDFSDDSDTSWPGNSDISDDSDAASNLSDVSDCSDVNDADSDDGGAEFDILDTCFDDDHDDNRPLFDSVDSLPIWTDDLHDVHIEEFTAQEGPRHSIDTSIGFELDYFKLFFSNEMIRHIPIETNSYAVESQVDKVDPQWYDVTDDEIRAFLGLLIVMGIVKLPSYKLYWSKESFLRNQGFVNVMPCNRFAKILQYLHINETTSPDDPLIKLRPLITDVLHNIRTHYKPKKCLSVDEGMVAYKGRHTAVQYMPSKPIKRGLKVWMFCDSKSGFCHNFQVYMGKVADGNNGPRGLGYRVVRELTTDLRGKYHHLFFDSFFTSVPLLRSLLQDSLYAGGTIRTNRKVFPQDFKNLSKLNQGQHHVCQDGPLVITAWCDSRVFHVLSTTSNPSGNDPALRQKDDGIRLSVSRPTAVGHYQRNFRGVDVCDQLREAYSVGRASKKWWRYIFHFIVNICIINAFITCKKSVPVGHRFAKKRYRQLDFRMNLVKQLVSCFQHIHKTRAAPGVLPLAASTASQHRWVRLQRKRSTCKWCRSKLGIRKETVYRCVACNQHFCSLAHHTAHHDPESLAMLSVINSEQ